MTKRIEQSGINSFYRNDEGKSVSYKTNEKTKLISYGSFTTFTAKDDKQENKNVVPASLIKVCK